MNLNNVVTNSERSCYACNFRWFIAYGLALYKPDHTAALGKGQAWHKMMEVYHAKGLEAAHRTREDLAAKWATDDVFDSVGTGMFTELKGMLDTYHSMSGSLPLTIAEVEQVYRYRLICPSGHASSVTDYAGRLDVLAIHQNSLWVADFKTSKRNPEDWLKDNGYRPQGYGYAWLVTQKHPDLHLGGIVWDVTRSVPPRDPASFEVIKSGQRLAKPSGGLPMTTAANFRQAVEMHGFQLGDEPWYQEVYLKLLDREPGFWCQRHWIPIDREELARTGRELYHVATVLRRERNRLNLARARCTTPEKTLEVIKKWGDKFPRNQACCREYNRQCRWYDLCRYRSIEALEGVTTGSLHVELSDNQEDDE